MPVTYSREAMLQGTVADERSLNRIFRLLANEQRRYVLYYLHEADTATELEDIALQITAWRGEKSTADVTETELEQTMARLRNVDLPKLADSGVVEYDSRTEMARFREPGRLFGLFLLLAARVERPLSKNSN
ncbi:hypothetical protein SAMN05421858_0235 [Haladaptatus litoreus]|uniref:DUF7344 domain-containing protein n=1 Tax=Haladaptatus litoreus TaxID=553468 RepID=A0A1N6V725_9EURY|nr:hypothetical protein [Haladaptatus litoreus]SIQ73602.1 hypothetical protein SAMN05421858_0235 [Haladaptatus litoreus]